MPISSTGFVITPSATAVAEAQQILIDTYGPNVNLTAASPNGLLVQNIAIAITMRETEQANTVNSFNPNIATGTQLDAICANLDIERTPATKSTATCQFTGLTGVSIPSGTQIQSVNNDIFIVDSTVVIGAMGTATGTVTAQVGGPISVAANIINKIITGISGWDTVNNSSVGSVGVAQESDAQLRDKRTSQLAFASSGSWNSVLAGALAYNPTSAYVTENLTNSTVVTDGISILPHSILLVLEGGGNDTQISNMFFQRLSGGGAMSGSYMPAPIPIPDSSETFQANWQKATARALGFNIQLKVGAIYPPSVADVIAAIINNPDNFSFDVIGRYLDATQFVYILLQNGISPIVSLTFNVGASTSLVQYTMPISDSLGTSMLSSNVSITYV